MVVKAILELGHIPVGMEMFSAADEEQWKIISRSILESDYYIIIHAHRYGSEVDGISFIEKEYDFAVSNRIPVISFLIDEEAEWPAGHVEKTSRKASKVKRFREKIMQKPVGFWKNADELYAKVSIALNKAFEDQPRTGWSRITNKPLEDELKPNYSSTSQRDISIRFSYRTESSQVQYDQSYIREINGKILGEEYFCRSNELSYNIGEIDATFINIGEAINDEVRVFDVFDETQSTMDLGFAIYDFEESDFNKNVVSAVGDDLFSNNILRIDRLVVFPHFRGKFIGYGALEDIVFNFASGLGVGLVVIDAIPMQFWSVDDEYRRKYGIDELSRNEQVSKAKLCNYFQRFGFVNLNRKSEFLIFSPARRKPNIFEIGYSDYISVEPST